MTAHAAEFFTLDEVNRLKIIQDVVDRRLIQIDGCDHRWFENRAPACTALVYVDDATVTKPASSESTIKMPPAAMVIPSLAVRCTN